MKKGCVIILLVCWAALGMLASGAEYNTKYDNIDVDKILQNGRVLNAYIKCMLDEGSCTAEGRELKKTLPDALATGCTKCNEKQKLTAEKVINHLMTKRANDWERLVKKYDPQGQFKKRFEAQGKKL